VKADPGQLEQGLLNHPGPIHILITDVAMPRVSGRDVARRAAELRPRLKALSMSGYAGSVLEHHGVFEEGVPFLQKPFTHTALRRMVQEVLDSPGRGQEALTKV
jgi:FixJ family two-component response regulator